MRSLSTAESALTIFYLPQQFLYFFPLPHGQGSLRPTFFSAIFGLSGFNKRVKSAISSGLSGSNSILYFHPFSSNIDVTSLNLASVWTLTTAGFFSVPNFAGLLPSNQTALLSPSNARIWVAIRSRNQRS